MERQRLLGSHILICPAWAQAYSDRRKVPSQVKLARPLEAQTQNLYYIASAICIDQSKFQASPDSTVKRNRFSLLMGLLQTDLSIIRLYHSHQFKPKPVLQADWSGAFMSFLNWRLNKNVPVSFKRILWFQISKPIFQSLIEKVTLLRKLCH